MWQPSSRATATRLSLPSRSSALAARTLSGSANAFGFPQRRPRRLAATYAALLRSEFLAASNSAIAPQIW